MTRTPSITRYGHGISAVDTDYVRPLLDASHIVIRDGRAAFVDTGTSHSVPGLLAALKELGSSPEQVDWVLLTHVHLDHAGGAGELIRHLPQAKLLRIITKVNVQVGILPGLKETGITAGAELTVLLLGKYGIELTLYARHGH